ncbi:hypothetical protein QM467_00565 [Rhodoblastus sp. 17X3]|uniref:hypothetical protein n=1 Tax=Rhodoblastus sp. 17X3 TaxID=3047026 RepID=UPI0024B873F0|nr:hypothetical protein [Rhodoblastus sp. 17X3]MDI9846543.1 hypothetical protein [Rhodoblastus sp. 17X3]
MNTANLQLEGVYAVLAALFQALVDKKVLDEEEVGLMLAEVERGIATGAGRPTEIRSSNVEAMCFPVRFLRSALKASSQGQRPSFAEVTARIRDKQAE